MHRVMLLVLLIASGLPAAGDGDDPLERSLRDLASPYSGARDRAVADLAAAGPEAEARLLAVYPTVDYLAQAAVLEALAARGSTAALPLVLHDLEAESRTVREAQARLMAALGEPAREALLRVAAGDDPARASRARDLRRVVVRVRVEQAILERTVGKPIRYRGQYARLAPDRDLATPVLLEMIAHENGGYRFLGRVWLVVDTLEVRSYAAEALADIGRPEDAAPLRAIHDRLARQMDFEEDWRRRLELEDLIRTVAHSLWDLGDKEPAEVIAQDLHDMLWQARGRTWAWGTSLNRVRSELAHTLLRMHRFARAEQIYREILEHPDAPGVSPGLCAYNLACALSLAGRQEDALSAILEAARHDPSVGDLAREDGDLRPLLERYPDLDERILEVAAGDDAEGD